MNNNASTNTTRIQMHQKKQQEYEYVGIQIEYNCVKTNKVTTDAEKKHTHKKRE